MYRNLEDYEMSMKKLLACLLALMMALALALIAWCGLRFRRMANKV